MLPTPSDNGARLAAILPTAFASMARAAGADHRDLLTRMLAIDSNVSLVAPPAVRSVLLIVVDGLGYSNLRAMAGHARTISALQTRRIETVIPSTTGAALTTITTGRLPGEHGLVGYKIMHPTLGLVTTLKDWQGIEDRRAWQRCTPLFGHAAEFGARAAVIGRPAHATGGLTEAILSGAEYLPGQTIADRFAIASKLLRSGDATLTYLYVDELDRAAHSEGWQSDTWVRRLEQLDAALDDLLRSLPGDVGVVLTADHGMLDVVPEKRLLLDDHSIPLHGVAEIGGEPRMRSLYLHAGAEAEEVATEVGTALGKRAWVGQRDEAIAANWFGPTDAEVAARLGEVLIVARGQYAFQLTTDDSAALAMVGQHGGLSDEERGVPLASGGAFTDTNFASAVASVASNLSSPDVR